MTQDQDLLEQQENKPKRTRKTTTKKKTDAAPEKTEQTLEKAAASPAESADETKTTSSPKKSTGGARKKTAEKTAAKPAEASQKATSAPAKQAPKSQTSEDKADQATDKPASSPKTPQAKPAKKPAAKAQNAPKNGTAKRPQNNRRKAANTEIVFNPEAFSDIYPSIAEAMLDEKVLADDGPQPALPGQPSLALPASIEDEDFLQALDEQVNGNRIVEAKPEPSSRNKRRSQSRSKNGRSSDKPAAKPAQAQQQQKPSPVSSKPAEPAEKSAPVQKAEPAQTSEKSGEQYSNLPVTALAPNQEESVASGKQEAKSRNAKNQKKPAKEQPLDKAPAPVSRTLYVSVIPDEQVEVLITEEGQVAEYFVEMAHQAKIRGNIYKGVINNVDANLQAAFVNFGMGKNGFLQIDEVHPEYYLNHVETKGGKYPPIQKVLKSGQEVLVQVVKEPSGSKGAFLTTWISLAGRFLVLTPGQEQIGISRKVEEQEERSRLKELLVGLNPGPNLGLILRTAGQGSTKTSIGKDLQYLKRLWKDILKKVASEPTPSLIYQEADLATRAVRDYLNDDINEIWVDDAQTQAGIQETTNLLFPRKPNMVKLHQDPRQTLWERFNLQRQIEEITSREVVLPSGGRLVFDQTEALMAIDINSGKVHGKSNGFEDMVYKTNLEAARAIARHLRLRDIGGQVVIDFIEMRDKGHVREVEKVLRNSMRSDRARHDIGHISSFGLLELVRQRIGTSAISISSEPCPHCHGTGVRRNMEWQAQQSLRDIQVKLRKAQAQADKNKNSKNPGNGGPKPLVYEMDVELGLYLLNHKRDRLLELENNYQTRIDVIPKA